jgi:4-amino-4-deoxy-L-arabinose transferase-like glycosyltransferase
MFPAGRRPPARPSAPLSSRLIQLNTHFDITRAQLAIGASARRTAPTAMMAVLVFFWLAASAWLRPLALPDEGRYVGVAYEMLRSGNWLVPTLDGLPFFHKPPLFYWLTAASLAAFGNSELAARLPSLLAATAIAMALYLFLRRTLGTGRASTTLLILATTPFFFGCAQFANLDMLVAACIGCAILCAADAALTDKVGRPRRATLLAAYAFAALGVLGKGLIGIALPVLVITAWLATLRQPALLLRLISPLGIALFALIAAPWFALVATRYPDFLHYFFVHHHFERYTTGDFNSQQPLWFYPAVLVGFTLPWFGSLPHALAPARSAAERRVDALMWTWLIATVVFFSIPKSKLPGYVLVAVPPVAALAARGLAEFVGKRTTGRQWTMAMFAGAIALLAAALGAGLVYERHNIRQLLVAARPAIAATDEVIALRNYPFSLAFYLRLRRPIGVVEDWDDQLLLRKDAWRKELWDAAAFADAPARAVLLRPAELTQHLACARDKVFIIADQQAAAGFPQIAGLARVASGTDYTIWLSPARAAGAAAGCPP